jgi:hypothetical protein
MIWEWWATQRWERVVSSGTQMPAWCMIRE